MVSKKLIIVIVVLIAVLIYFNIPKGIAFDNLDPQSLTLVEETGQQTVNFQINDQDGQKYEKIVVYPNVQDSSKKYLHVENLTYSDILTGSQQKTGVLKMPFTAINSEGYQIKYKVNLELYSNDVYMKTMPIDVKITPSSYKIYQQPTIENNNGIKFDSLSTSSFNLVKGSTQYITFQLKNQADKTFNNIVIKANIENNSGEYLKVNDLKYNQTLSGIGATTGVLTMPFISINSEGEQLNYKVDLVVYSEGISMDTKQVDVTITK